MVRLMRVAALVAAALTVAGCAQTTRVDDDLSSTASLSRQKKGVALVKLGAADPLCTTVTAGIGVREKDSFRRIQNVRIVLTKTEAQVAEVALDPGEYHVVSYVCQRARGVLALAEPINAFEGVYRRSYANFRVEPGEIVNVGYLQLVPLRTTYTTFTRTVPVGLAGTDWPLAELERFKQQRPKLYEQMRTRLMVVPKVEPPTAEQVQAKCAEMKKLQAEGKLQNLPQICTAPATPKTTPGGIAKRDIRA
jgi:hypothetical protein